MSILLETGIQSSSSVDFKEILPLIGSYRLIPRLVGELIIDRAIANYTCSEAEIDEAYQQFCQQQQIVTDKELCGWLKQNFMTRQQLKAFVERKQSIEKFKQANWNQQLKSFFHLRKPQLDRVIYSFIQVDDRDLAWELYFRLQAKEASFADLAYQYSQSSYAQTKGLIGPVELGSCPTHLVKMLSSSQAGQIFPPQIIGSSVVIVQFERYISAQLDIKMQKRLLDELFGRWLQEQIIEHGQNLLATVEV